MEPRLYHRTGRDRPLVHIAPQDDPGISFGIAPFSRSDEIASANVLDAHARDLASNPSLITLFHTDKRRARGPPYSLTYASGSSVAPVVARCRIAIAVVVARIGVAVAAAIVRITRACRGSGQTSTEDGPTDHTGCYSATTVSTTVVAIARIAAPIATSPAVTVRWTSKADRTVPTTIDAAPTRASFSIEWSEDAASQREKGSSTKDERLTHGMLLFPQTEVRTSISIMFRPIADTEGPAMNRG